MRIRIQNKLANRIVAELERAIPDVEIVQVRATNSDQGLNYFFIIKKVKDPFQNLNFGLLISRIQKNILNKHNIYFSFKFLELDTPIFSDLLKHEYPYVINKDTKLDSTEKNLYFTY